MSNADTILLSGVRLSTSDIKEVIHAHGGAAAVTKKRLWSRIANDLCWPGDPEKYTYNMGSRLKKKYLQMAATEDFDKFVPVSKKPKRGKGGRKRKVVEVKKEEKPVKEKPPTDDVDYAVLVAAVEKLGGFDKVCEKKWWFRVCKAVYGEDAKIGKARSMKIKYVRYTSEQLPPKKGRKSKVSPVKETVKEEEEEVPTPESPTGTKSWLGAVTDGIVGVARMLSPFKRRPARPPPSPETPEIVQPPKKRARGRK